MEGNQESDILGYPKIITYECTKKIIKQMEKNVFKIKTKDGQGTGFFCKIPFPDETNMLPVLMTNNHVIDKDILINERNIKIYIEEEFEEKIINLNNRMKYTNKDYETTIIEIREEDNINSFLELDEKIINGIISNKNENLKFEDKTMYIVQYPEGELSVSYGVLSNIYEDKKYNFQHKCCTKNGSSGSPILNKNNNKIIGIHREGLKNSNKGTFLNYPIREFIRNEFLLKKFNKKQNLFIEGIYIDTLDLCNKDIEDEDLKDLSEIEFKNLKKMNLSRNSISDINSLEKSDLKELKELDLSHNKISDIKIFDKVKFDK